MSPSVLWIVVPAAGIGDRFQQSLQATVATSSHPPAQLTIAPGLPKQYQKIDQRSVLQVTLQKVSLVPTRALVVVVAPNDNCWREQLDGLQIPNLEIVLGGQTRGDSVRAGLASLAERADENDWVMVHDVVRPCVLAVDCMRLMAAVQEDTCGGLLALPVSETVKRQVVQPSRSSRVGETVSREGLWLAQTPQIFRYGVLKRALAQSSSATDESAAVEALGYQPLLVSGQRDNLKITWPEDLLTAREIIARQEALG